jgi:hypothetical protein
MKSAQIKELKLPPAVLAALDEAERTRSKFTRKGWPELALQIVNAGAKRNLSAPQVADILHKSGMNYSRSIVAKKMQEARNGL